MTRGFNQAAIDNQEPDEGWALCPNCGGAGFFLLDNRRRVTCMTCKGDGVMSADEAHAIMENHLNHD